MSILFSDLVGFTTHSEQNPPEIVIRDLNRYIGDMEPIMLSYRGHIELPSAEPLRKMIAAVPESMTASPIATAGRISQLIKAAT